jgi:8-amino-7-oxononanoate synthase
MYKKELKAIKKAHLFRERVLFDTSLLDLASNDYLGLAEDSALFDAAVKRVKAHKIHGPKASQLVNGYHPIHKEFENYLKVQNGFEEAIVVGSGFLANLSLIEALPRKKDILILDEEYHASGIIASKLLACKVLFFKHNDADDLARILEEESYQRAIVAVEGIYSMGGDLLSREIFSVCDRFDALLIVDEAHSSGVLGRDFLGVFTYYAIVPKKNHIKMGTLGKALGSYGAYILASNEIITFLLNRAKAIIYATAPSIFDIALAHEGYKMIEKKRDDFYAKKILHQGLALDIFGIDLKGLILKIEVADSQKVQALKAFALNEGVVIGAIRPPTVKKAILRVILRLNVDSVMLEKFLVKLKEKLDAV